MIDFQKDPKILVKMMRKRFSSFDDESLIVSLTVLNGMNGVKIVCGNELNDPAQ